MSIVRKSVVGDRPTILTNDPSMTAWGWAVVDYSGKVLDSGAIKTESVDKKLRIRKGDDRTRRVNEIAVELLSLIRKHKVTYLLSELPHGSQSAVAAVAMGQCVGLLQSLAACLELGIEWYSEGDAKLCVANARSVPKNTMVTIISKRYAVRWTHVKWIDQAVADALAVHACALMQSSVLKFLISLPNDKTNPNK